MSNTLLKRVYIGRICFFNEDSMFAVFGFIHNNDTYCITSNHEYKDYRMFNIVRDKLMTNTTWVYS